MPIVQIRIDPDQRSARRRLEATIEHLVALLDRIDGDADFEIDEESEDERELDQAEWGICDRDAMAEYFPESSAYEVL